MAPKKKKKERPLRFNAMALASIAAFFCLIAIPAEANAGSSSCPAEWKKTISKYPYDDERGGHLGYLLTNPYFPRDACYCDINYRNIVDWRNSMGGKEAINEWKNRCEH
jgi:hypothetical protein